MTIQKIYSERPDIKAAVEERHPITKGEKKCPRERSKMEGLRFEMAKKLYFNPEAWAKSEATRMELAKKIYNNPEN